MRKLILATLNDNKSLFCFVILMLVFRSSLADFNHVPTGSMKPTIAIGDRIFVNKMAYDLRVPFTHKSLHKRADPQRGDIVVFDSHVSEKRLVKRVLGLPGDTVELRNNLLMINGQMLDYEPISSSPSTIDKKEILADTSYTIRINRRGSSLSGFKPVLVPDGHYLTLGDSRDDSADSRVIGFVPRNEIVGRASGVFWSADYDNYYLPRPDRFFKAL